MYYIIIISKKILEIKFLVFYIWKRHKDLNLDYIFIWQGLEDLNLQILIWSQAVCQLSLSPYISPVRESNPSKRNTRRLTTRLTGVYYMESRVRFELTNMRVATASLKPLEYPLILVCLLRFELRLLRLKVVCFTC